MIFKGLLDDARSIRDRDPAARTTLEVFLLYQGFHALILHRQAHWLYKHKRFFLARWLSQFARHLTGIEIHPGATIGRRLFIDQDVYKRQGQYLCRTAGTDLPRCADCTRA